MSISTAVLISLAGKLISQWKDQLPDEHESLLPDEIDLAAQLKSLALKSVHLNTDFLPKLEVANSATSALVGLAETTIGRLSSRLGMTSIPGLSFTNILSRTLAEQINRLSCCNGEVQQPADPADPAFRRPDAWESLQLVDFFLYFVESTPPNVVDVNRAIEKAWRHWKNVAKIMARRVYDPSKANVIIRSIDFIDGPHGTLARAHEGPPQGRKLVIELERGEDWSNPSHKFEVILAHEIGHVLGLFRDTAGHNPLEGHLMSAYVKDSVTELSDEDGDEAVRVYGPRLIA